MILTQSIRVHSRLIKYNWSKLYYFFRSLDSEGSGKVCIWHIDIPWPRSSYYRWLKQGLAVGAFRNYWTDGLVLVVYLGSKANICKQLGLKTWGAVAEVPLNEVSRELATELELVWQQEQAKHATRKKHKRQPNEPSFQTWEKGTCARYGRYYVGANALTYGVSQQRVADSLGICTRSVYNHYKRQGLPALQIAQEVPGTDKQLDDFLNSEELSPSGSRYVQQGKRVFCLKQNIYRKQVSLCSERYQRSQFLRELGHCLPGQKRNWHGREGFRDYLFSQPKKKVRTNNP